MSNTISFYSEPTTLQTSLESAWGGAITSVCTTVTTGLGLTLGAGLMHIFSLTANQLLGVSPQAVGIATYAGGILGGTIGALVGGVGVGSCLLEGVNDASSKVQKVANHIAVAAGFAAAPLALAYAGAALYDANNYDANNSACNRSIMLGGAPTAQQTLQTNMIMQQNLSTVRQNVYRPSMHR